MKCMQLLCTVFGLSLMLSGGDGAWAQQDGTVLDDGLFRAPHEGGARRWSVESADGLMLRRAPGGAQTVGKALAPASVLTNFGCLETMGTLWCEVRPLHGGPRGFVLADALTPTKGPDGIVARGANDTAERAKKKRFDTTGQIPCAQEQGEPLSTCIIGVAQSDGGDVTAAVTFRTGFSRYLFFMHGQFISASATMSGAGRDTNWAVENGVHVIRADDQQFEIPNALLFGQD